MEILLLQASKTWEPEPQLWRSKETVSTWREHTLWSLELRKECVRESRKRKGTYPRLGRMNLKVTERRLEVENAM